jgi:hypothetical protein
MAAIEIDVSTRRSGPGWAAWVGPTTITLIVEDRDILAGKRALRDLETWTNSEDWICDESGWTDDGCSIFTFSYEPANQPEAVG